MSDSFGRVSGRRRGEQPWNLNIHYDALLDSRVPPGVACVLDVGCGDGFLAARLARRIPHVTALDVDAPVLKRAQDRFTAAPVTWMHGDVMTADLAGFDAVLSNAVLHHLAETGAALRRFAGLVKPGGTVAIVAFVRPSVRSGWWHLASWVACAVVNRIKGKWEHTAPIVWPPRENLRQLREVVHAALPGARMRRLLYGRVLITWRAPD